MTFETREKERLQKLRAISRLCPFFVHTCVCVVADENMSLAHSDADAVDVATPPQSDGETSPHSESETDPEGNPSGENEVNIGKKLCKVSVQ